MYKKLLAIAFAFMLALGMTACGGGNDSDAVNGFDEAIDVEFAKEIAQTISEFGDDRAQKFGFAYSHIGFEVAEKRFVSGDHIIGDFMQIGLQFIIQQDIHFF